MNIGDTVNYRGKPGRKPVQVVIVHIGTLITIRFLTGTTRAVVPWRLTPREEQPPRSLMKFDVQIR